MAKRGQVRPSTIVSRPQLGLKYFLARSFRFDCKGAEGQRHCQWLTLAGKNLPRARWKIGCCYAAISTRAKQERKFNSSGVPKIYRADSARLASTNLVHVTSRPLRIGSVRYEFASSMNPSPKRLAIALRLSRTCRGKTNHVQRVRFWPPLSLSRTVEMAGFRALMKCSKVTQSPHFEPNSRHRD